MLCIGCKAKLDDSNSLKCNTCNSHYCLECLNFGVDKKIKDLDPDQLSSLKCPSCTNVSRNSRRKKGTEASAVLSPTVTSLAPKQVTIESISALLDQKLAPTSSIMINSRNVLIQEVKSLITTEMSKLISELRVEFTKTTDFIMDEVKDLKQEIATKDKIIQTLQNDQTQLKNEINVIRSRFNVLEKLSRDRNVEVQAVPENRNENVVSLFKELCNTIKYPILDSNIQSCRRVAKMDSASKRPRNIVVTLSSPRLRDEIISATHRYNKEHKQNKLNSLHMGLTGECHQIYVTEHLSPDTKQLYAAARRFAKDNNYTYSWVKYGQIYLRKTDRTDAIQVKNLEMLSSLK